MAETKVIKRIGIIESTPNNIVVWLYFDNGDKERMAGFPTILHAKDYLMRNRINVGRRVKEAVRRVF